MPPEIVRWLLAFAAAVLVAGLARSRRSLSVDGMVAAITTGTIIVGTAGWWAGLLLVIFFASASVLSRASSRSAIDQARGAERDAVQVLANGGVPLLAAIFWSLFHHHAWVVALAGAVAAANADTWSTEIGRTSRSLPRLLTTGRTVVAGTSGAVSRRGLAGAVGGGALIGVLAGAGWTFGWLPGHVSPMLGIIAVSLGGVAGSVIDSLLGATVQDQRWCDACGKATEQRVHRCGTATRSVRGIPWIDNDVVNVTCSAAGGVVAVALSLVL